MIPPKLKQKKVLVLPFDDKNPYQREISRALGEYGYESIHCGSSWLMNRLIAVHDPSIIHFHWLHRWTQKTSWFKLLVYLPWMRLQLWRFRNRGGRIYWTLHNLVNHEGRGVRRELLLCKLIGGFSNRIFAHSEAAAVSAARLYKLPPDKFVIVPHPSYVGQYPVYDGVHARNVLEIAPDKIVFLVFGRMRKYKGVDLLIEAARDLNREIVILLVGQIRDPGIRASVTSWAEADKRIKPVVKFVDDAEVGLYFAAADACIFMHAETLTSGAALLAMSFGRSCVAPDTTAFSSVMEPGDNFLYVAGASAALKSALEAATNAGRTGLAERGKQNLLRAQELTWERAAGNIKDSYESEERR